MRPGPTVQATAATSGPSTPPSSMASATTGVSRSTWARQAISGTTPPKRACRSIWLDTTDDSTSRPVEHHGRGRLVARRLDPQHPSVGHDPIPSPRTVTPGTAASISVERPRERRLVDVLGPHHQRILVRLDVVVLPDAGGPEAEASVEVLGPGVADPHLEGEVPGAAVERGPGQLGEEARPDRGAVPRGVDGDRGDVRVVAGEHEPGVADHDCVDPGHEVEAARPQRELGEEQAERPGSRVHLGLDPQHRAEVPAAHRDEVDLEPVRVQRRLTRGHLTGSWHPS